ncbi:MAG: glycosyltransferase [Rhizobiaceae bacterium]
MGRNRKNISKFLRCFRTQCAQKAAQPCWLRCDTTLPNGVNIHGYFLSEIGLGESARLLHASLSHQKIPVAACNRVLEGRQNDPQFTKIVSDDAPYSVSLSIDGLPGYRGLRHIICRKKYNIAYPFWELEAIPKQYISYLRRFDSVWAPSTFIYNSLVSHGLKKVALVKHPLLAPALPPRSYLPGDTLKCLFYFDFDSFPTRKNPEAAILAFRQAFKNQRDVSLTVKTRGERDMGRRRWLADQAANDSRIKILDRNLTRTQMTKLMEEHDVFLSLHRSEGLGLGCAEALAAGKIVVATDYGGSTDFIAEDTAFPVAWDRVGVAAGEYVLADNATWADPSIDDAARQLRAIYDDPVAASQRAMQGYRRLIAQHSLAVVGRNIEAILQRAGVS